MKIDRIYIILFINNTKRRKIAKQSARREKGNTKEDIWRKKEKEKVGRWRKGAAWGFALIVISC
jgi:hypothetical protein